MGFRGDGEFTIKGVGYNKYGKKIFNRKIGNFLELNPREFVTYRVHNVSNNRIVLFRPMKKFEGRFMTIDFEELRSYRA